MIDLKHGIAGGLAGISIDILIYPFEAIKTRIMASHPGKNFESVPISRFKGFECQMLISFPFSFTFFLVYQKFRLSFHEIKYKNFFASITAEFCANIVRNPIQVIKQQIMIGRVTTIREGSQVIWNHQGIKGFYSGFRMTLARGVSFSSIQLPLFQFFRENFPIQGIDPIIKASISGSLAAVISAFFSCPFDVIRSRMMTRNMKKQKRENLIK